MTYMNTENRRAGINEITPEEWDSVYTKLNPMKNPEGNTFEDPEVQKDWVEFTQGAYWEEKSLQLGPDRSFRLVVPKDFEFTHESLNKLIGMLLRAYPTVGNKYVK